MTSVTLPAQSDGGHTFYFKAKDNVGNIGNWGSHGFQIETTLPTDSISINDGDTYVASTSVTLTLTYGDVTSGVHQVRYSNDGVWDTEPWESPSSIKAWTLNSGDGTKTVHYQVEDNAGLVSSTYSYNQCVLGWNMVKYLTSTLPFLFLSSLYLHSKTGILFPKPF